MEQEQMQLDFYAMLQEKKKEENKKTEAKPTKPIKAAEKKTSSNKKEEKTKEDKKQSRYVYPFSLYTEGRTVDISNYGFEDEKAYTEKEITEIMLKHRHYEFSGEMTYSMIEEDNTLVATAKQYKKG